MKTLLKCFIVTAVLLCSCVAVSAAGNVEVIENQNTNEYIFSGITGSGQAEQVTVTVTYQPNGGSPIYSAAVTSTADGRFAHRFFLPVELESAYLYANFSASGGKGGATRFLHVKRAIYSGVVIDIPGTSCIMDKGVADFGVYAYQTDTASRNYTVEYSVDGGAYANAGTFAVPNGVRTSYSVPLTHLTKGIHTLAVRVTAPSQPTVTRSEKITVIDRYYDKPLDRFSSIAIDFALGYDSKVALPGYIDMMKYAGFKTARPAWISDWENYETTPGIYNTGMFENTLYSPLKNAGISMFNTLNPVHQNYGWVINSVADKALAGYAAAIAPYSDMIEIFNEPDTQSYSGYPGTAATYASTVKTVGAKLHEKDRTKTVVAGAVSSHDGNSVTFLNAMFGQGVYPYIDAVSFHPYFAHQSVDIADTTSNRGYKPRVLKYIKPADDNGGWLDLVMSEFGFLDSDALGSNWESMQAENTVKAQMINLNAGVKQTNWFQLTEILGGEKAITDENKRPRPAYAALANMTNQLNNAFYVGQLPTPGDNIEMHIFNRLGVTVLVAWRQRSYTYSTYTGKYTVTARSPVDYEFPSWDSPSAIDMYGNSVSVVNKKVSIGAEPKYVTGLNLDWLTDAAKNELNAIYGTLKVAPYAGAAGIINNLQATVTSSGWANSHLEAIYNAGHALMDQYSTSAFCTQTQLAFMLWKLQQAAEKTALVQTASGSYEAVEIPDYDPNTWSGDYEKFSRKIMRRAELTMKDAELINNAGAGSFGTRYAAAKSFMAKSLVGWAQHLDGMNKLTANVTNIAEGSGIIMGSVDVRNYSGVYPKELNLILASYDGGELLDVNIQKIFASNGKSQSSVTLPIDGSYTLSIGGGARDNSVREVEASDNGGWARVTSIGDTGLHGISGRIGAGQVQESIGAEASGAGGYVKVSPIGKSGVFAITGQSAAALGDPITIMVKSHGGDKVHLGYTLAEANGKFSYSFDLAYLPAGQYTVSFGVGAGQSPPTVTFSHGSVGAASAFDGSAVSILVKSDGGSSVHMGYAVTEADGSFAYSFNLGALPTGEYTVSFGAYANDTPPPVTFNHISKQREGKEVKLMLWTDMGQIRPVPLYRY